MDKSALAGILALTNLVSDVHRTNTEKKILELESEKQEKQLKEEREFRRETLFLQNALNALNTTYTELNDKTTESRNLGILDMSLSKMDPKDRTVGSEVLTSQNIKEVENSLSKIRNKITYLDKGINDYTYANTVLAKEIDKSGLYDGTVTPEEIKTYELSKTNPASINYDANYKPLNEFQLAGITNWNLDPAAKIELDTATLNYQMNQLKFQMMPLEYANQFESHDMTIKTQGLNLELLQETVNNKHLDTVKLNQDIEEQKQNITLNQIKIDNIEKIEKKEDLVALNNSNLALQSNVTEQLNTAGNNIFFNIKFRTDSDEFTTAYTFVSEEDPASTMEDIKEHNLYIGEELTRFYEEYMSALEDETIPNYSLINQTILEAVPHINNYRYIQEELAKNVISSLKNVAIADLLGLGYNNSGTGSIAASIDGYGVVKINTYVQQNLLKHLEKNGISQENYDFIIENFDSIARGFEWTATGIVDNQATRTLVLSTLPNLMDTNVKLKDNERAINQEIYYHDAESLPGVSIPEGALKVLDDIDNLNKGY